MDSSATYIHSHNKSVYWLSIIAIVTGLYLTTMVNYLLFHSLVELFSIIVAFSVFVITWNSVRYINSPYLLIVGISFLFIGVLDLLHTLAYKGMPIFTDYDYYANQLWIAARYLESITLLGAFALLGSKIKVKPGLVVACFAVITSLLVASIFYFKIFPVCFVEGQGQTEFKIFSEYIICSILFVNIALLVRSKKHFTEPVFRFLLLSLIYTIISELAFTFYIDNYGISNLVGHYFKLFSFTMIYHAIITTGIEDPYSLIFKELNHANRALHEEIALRKETEIAREAVITSLQEALEEIKTLKGILPICMHCKKIRDDSGYWNQLETYIHKHSGVDFSHGICPDCINEHYSEYISVPAKSE